MTRNYNESSQNYRIYLHSWLNISHRHKRCQYKTERMCVCVRIYLHGFVAVMLGILVLNAFAHIHRHLFGLSRISILIYSLLYRFDPYRKPGSCSSTRIMERSEPVLVFLCRTPSHSGYKLSAFLQFFLSRHSF